MTPDLVVSASPDRAWRDHLIGGGTTPWPVFRDSTRAAGSASVAQERAPGSASVVEERAQRASRNHQHDALRTERGTPRSTSLSEGPLPGAQHLELLRRLNTAAAEAGAVLPSGLAQQVLATNAVGRGLPDLDLVGVTGARGYGFAPVDPAEIASEELLRVATWLLTQQLAQCEPPAEPKAHSCLRPHRLRRRWRLVGDPLIADPLRRQLTAQGHAPRGGGPVYVAAASMGQLLADCWTTRCFSPAGAPRWGAWVQRLHAADRLPASADLAALATTWQRQSPRGAVQLVVDPVTLRTLLPGRVRPLVVRPSWAAAELARQLTSLFGLLPTPHLPADSEQARPDEPWFRPVDPAQARTRYRQAQLSGVLLPAMMALTRPDELPPQIPPVHLAWVREQASRQAELLADYPVHGAPEGLLAALRADPLAGQPQAQSNSAGSDAVLDLAVRLLANGALIKRDQEGEQR